MPKHRDSKQGKFVSAEHATANPDTTQAETSRRRPNVKTAVKDFIKDKSGIAENQALVDLLTKFGEFYRERI